MTDQEIVKASIDFLNIIVSWQIVIVILVFIFRKRVEEAIGALIGRLRSVSIAGASAEFESAFEGINRGGRRTNELEDSEAPEALREVVAPDTSVDETEISELDKQMENLRK